MADASGTDPRASARTRRPAPIDREPGVGLAATLTLLDDIDRVAQRVQPLLHTVNRMTGLSSAQIGILLAFADGSQPPVGTTPDSAPLTELARKGLLAPGEAPPDETLSGEGPGRPAWRLTDAGRATLGQVQGLRIRALGTLLTALDDEQVAAIHAALRGIIDALDDLPVAGDDETP